MVWSDGISKRLEYEIGIFFSLESGIWSLLSGDDYCFVIDSRNAPLVITASVDTAVVL
jgi:hypothetical protein